MTASVKKKIFATRRNCSDRFFGIKSNNEYLEVRIAFVGYFGGCVAGGKFACSVRAAGSSNGSICGVPVFPGLRNTASHERGMSGPMDALGPARGSGAGAASDVADRAGANGLSAACAISEAMF